jgi:hypothetical protein
MHQSHTDRAPASPMLLEGDKALPSCCIRRSWRGGWEARRSGSCVQAVAVARWWAGVGVGSPRSGEAL